MLFWSRKGACSNNEPAQSHNIITVSRGLAALAVLTSIASVARAQDVPPGVVANFDFTQRLEYSDNPDLDFDGDSDFFGRTILAFGLESITKVQAFSFDIGTDIEEWRDDESGVNFTNSFFALDYDRNTRNALLGFNASYRETDNDGNVSDEEFDQDGNIINQNDGTREFYRLGLEAEVGREAPIGASFAWIYSELNYTGTNDPSLNDQSTNDFSGQVDFRIDPRITANLTARYIDFDAGDNGVSRETTGLGAGVVLEVSKVLTTAIGLSYDNIDRSGTETGSDDGLAASIDVTRALTNGTMGVAFDTEVATNDNGRRSFLSFNRDMELPRGTLAYSLGVTGAGDVIGQDPLFSVDYTHVRSTQLIGIGLSQQVRTDDNNDEQIDTTLRATFDQRINNSSSFGVNLSIFDRNELGDNPNDGQRIELGVTYQYDLTRDWGLVGGYSYTRTTEDNASDRTRNTVFVGLQRNFQWLP